MFNDSFYPTPDSIIEMMLSGVEIENKTILEPSAGKGNILNYISKKYRHNRPQLYCIEIEPELCHILREEGYKVISNDFLNYSGNYYFDVIVMNPPFKNGVDHILKAWDILQNGEITCLLNSETVRNPYTSKRHLLNKLIEDYGSVEHVGSVFKDAERNTDAEVCIVRLRKQSKDDKFSFQFEKVNNGGNIDINESVIKDTPALNDVIGNMIIQNDKALEYYIKLISCLEGLEYYCINHDSYFKVKKEALESYTGNNTSSYNSFNDKLKKQLWNLVLDKLKVDRYMTSSVRENFSKFSNAQGYMDFTKENVLNVVELLLNNKTEILERAILDVFDLFTKYYKENRSHIEGWKTNDAWRVNKKIILPYWLNYGGYCNGHTLQYYGDKFTVNYDTKVKFSDIDKVMCYITGKRYEDCYTIYDALDFEFNILGNVKTGERFKNTTESQFFKLKFYKKGTLHLEFKDSRLWQEFNIRACKGKQWLPGEAA